MKNLLYFIFSLFLCLQAEITFAATQSNYSQISQKLILSSSEQNSIQKKLGKKLQNVGNAPIKFLKHKGKNNFIGKFFRFVSMVALVLVLLAVLYILFLVLFQGSLTTIDNVGLIALSGIALFILCFAIVEIFDSPFFGSC